MGAQSSPRSTSSSPASFAAAIGCRVATPPAYARVSPSARAGTGVRTGMGGRDGLTGTTAVGLALGAGAGWPWQPTTTKATASEARRRAGNFGKTTAAIVAPPRRRGAKPKLFPEVDEL